MTDVFTTDFEGFTARDQLSTFVANAAVTGAPFARNITPLPISRPGITFPRVNPSGFGWVAEGAPIPDVDLNDDAYSIAASKLAGILTMSSEFIDDNELPISGLLGEAVADSMGPTLDEGLLYGSGLTPEPEGILVSADFGPARGNLREAVIACWGELVDAGADGEGIVCFASGSIVAAEMGRTNDEGTPIHPAGSVPMIGPGIRMVAVPTLSAPDVLVADVRRLYLVLRDDFEAKMSTEAKFTTDQIAVRIKGRFSVACPTAGKALRRANHPESQAS
jgi:HK97 family phage major capsid protein